MANNERNRLEEIKKRRKQRERARMIRILIVLAVFVLIIVGIVSAIGAIAAHIKNNTAKVSPTPIPVISENVESAAPQPSDEADVPSASPEPAQTLPPASEQNDIIKFLESTASDKKVCYLTFDDGPNNSITPKILDTLRKYNVKATFFEVGSLIKDNPDMARRVYEEGHLVANHSYTHTYSKLYASGDTFTEEIRNCEGQIKSVVGDDFFPLVRFPGGSYNAGTYGEQKQQYKEILAQMGYYQCDWNALNGDAEGGSKSSEQLIERVKTSSKDKNQVVVLMHDAANKKATAEALPKIIEYFMAEGYTFSRLDKPVY